ncbi:SKP1-like protein 14 [Pistacia vera]|uniref:SKP1-like protein 14 n=1 Tax=Pistacia vera TaxID=55513 RepID=UPI0012636631|nr:SKP1-like protein 14 [Pistacia vera]
MAANQVDKGKATTQEPLPLGKKKITLKAEDGHLFEIERAVAMDCLGIVKTFFEENEHDDDNVNVIVPLPNVSSAALTQIIKYCKKHVGFREDEADEPKKAEMKAFDGDFINHQSVDMLKEILLAANYLNVKSLLELAEDNVAERIKNKSVEYVREFFGIENDFTEEEENRLREENSWAFEGVDAD